MFHHYFQWLSDRMVYNDCQQLPSSPLILIGPFLLAFPCHRHQNIMCRAATAMTASCSPLAVLGIFLR